MLERTQAQIKVKSSIPKIHLFESGDLNISQVFHNLMTDTLAHIAKLGLYDMDHNQ